MSKGSHRFVDLVLGQLPHEALGRALGVAFEAGDVKLSRAAQRHVSADHPEDYAICLPHIAQVIAAPLYAGDDFKNPGNFEIVGRVASIDQPILIAITFEKDDDGFYRVVTFYRVSEKKVVGRREKRHLVGVPV